MQTHKFTRPLRVRVLQLRRRLRAGKRNDQGCKAAPVCCRDVAQSLCYLQVEEMESALLATFCGSPDWVHSQFPSHVKLALVQPAGGAEKGSTTTLAPNLKLFVPFKSV